MGSNHFSLGTRIGSGASCRVVFGTTAVVVVLSGCLFAGEGAWPSLPTIAWAAGSVRLVAERGDYGRMVRLDDGRTACVYDRDRRMWIRHGDEQGMRWAEPVLVAEEPDCWLTNADLLPLRDGTLLYFWDERPLAALAYQHQTAPPGYLTRPFRIRMARSGDRGRTWSPPRTIHTAGPSYQDGCWEPAAIQLPSGEVQVFFADESRFPDTAEQEIARLRSPDGGTTWGRAERVSLRAGHRDGMPAPVVLAGARGVVAAIEDDGLSGGRFKPVIIAITPAKDGRSGVVGADSPNRWGALAEPLDPAWYGGAPCLRHLPSGETLLSYQESADGTLGRCRMAVCVGDRDGRHFTHKTYPLPLESRGNQVWNSLFVKDEHTVTAVLTATVGRVRGVWAVDGRVTSDRPALDRNAVSSPPIDVRGKAPKTPYGPLPRTP